MKIKFYKIFFLLTISVAFLSVKKSKAQEAFYGAVGLKRSYYSTLVNPALVPDSSIVQNSLSFVPFFPVSPFDMGASIRFSAFSLGDLTSSIKGNVLDLNTLVNKMNSSSSADLGLGFNVSLFHVYLTTESNARIEVSQRIRSEFSTNLFNQNLLYALFNNSASVKNINWSDMRSRGIVWNEIAFGYTKPIDDKWTVGGRLKLLTGLLFFDFSAENLGATLGGDGNSIYMQGTFRTAGLPSISDSVYSQSLKKYDKMSVGANHGLAVDLGANYHLDDDIDVFFGVNDLGFIRWSMQPLTYNAKGSATNFAPVQQTGTGGSLNFDVNLDNVKDQLKQGTVSTAPFYSSLSSHWNGGARWKYQNWFHATSMVDFYIVQGRFAYPGVTLAGTLNAGRWAEFSLSSGYNYGRYARLGFGTSFNWFLGIKPLRFTLFSNNVLGFLSASNLRSADMQFSLSWTWSNKKRKAKKKIPKMETDSMLSPNYDLLEIVK